MAVAGVVKGRLTGVCRVCYDNPRMTNTSRCLICESETPVHFLDAVDHVTGQTFELRRCPECGFVFTWPQPPNLNDYYPPYYRRYNPLILQFFKTLQQLKARRWTRTFGNTGRALEIGCGEAWMLAALKGRGWRVLGIERTPGSAQFAAHTLGVPMIVGGLNALHPAARFDLIVLHHVLEHLPQPLQTLRDCARHLTPQGRLVLEVPNLGSWQFRYARQQWVHVDVPRHLGHFTREALQQALARAGLEAQDYRCVSLEYDPYGWLQAVLNQLGFPQNLLLQWLAGNQRQLVFTPRGVLMLLVSVVLALPSLALSVVSWIAGQGAIMEVQARPAAGVSADATRRVATHTSAPQNRM